MDVIKKAYVQEEECENSEVSPREVGHNIYILALQVHFLQIFMLLRGCKDPALMNLLPSTTSSAVSRGHCSLLTAWSSLEGCPLCT